MQLAATPDDPQHLTLRCLFVSRPLLIASLRKDIRIGGRAAFYGSRVQRRSR